MTAAQDMSALVAAKNRYVKRRVMDYDSNLRIISCLTAFD